MYPWCQLWREKKFDHFSFSKHILFLYTIIQSNVHFIDGHFDTFDLWSYLHSVFLYFPALCSNTWGPGACGVSRGGIRFLFLLSLTWPKVVLAVCHREKTNTITAVILNQMLCLTVLIKWQLKQILWKSLWTAVHMQMWREKNSLDLENQDDVWPWPWKIRNWDYWTNVTLCCVWTH